MSLIVSQERRSGAHLSENPRMRKKYSVYPLRSLARPVPSKRAPLPANKQARPNTPSNAFATRPLQKSDPHGREGERVVQ